MASTELTEELHMASTELTEELAPNRQRTLTEDRSPKDTVSELPDLSDRLRASGVFDEYTKFRKNYMQWRRGEGRGAAGEITALPVQIHVLSTVPAGCVRSAASDLPRGASSLSLRRPSIEEFSKWFPTPQKFTFFYTIAFWTAITSTIGSFILVFTSSVNLLGIPYDEDLLLWSELMLSIMFLVSTYGAYLDIINLQCDATNYIWPPGGWKEALRRAQFLESVIGVVSFFVAMLLWMIPATLAVLPTSWQPASVACKFIFCKLPNLLGGFGFLLGGICECVHNKDYLSMFEPVVWISFFNTLGGLNFFLGCAATMSAEPSPAAKEFSHFNLWMGGICYVFGSSLMLVMWRANDFGLCLMNQLNNAVKSGHGMVVGAQDGGFNVRLPVLGTSSFSPTLLHEASDAALNGHQLSIRGASFLVLYCYLFAASYVNCVSITVYDERALQQYTDFAMSFIWILVVSIVLVVHSAVTSAPNRQPYRFAMLAMRLVLIIAAIVQSIVLADFGRRRTSENLVWQ